MSGTVSEDRRGNRFEKAMLSYSMEGEEVGTGCDDAKVLMISAC